MAAKTVARIAIVAALYAAVTWALAPISYGPIQFRVSEALKVLVLFNPLYAVGIGIGTLIANLSSPFAGPWDLVFMPVTDVLGGLLAWGLYRGIRQWSIFPSLVLYAVTTGLAVGLMLSFFGLGFWYIAALPIIASELIILLAVSPLLWKGLQWARLS